MYPNFDESIDGSLVSNWGLGCVDAELLLQSFSFLFAFEFLGVRNLLLDSMDEGDAIIDISSDEENLVDESFDITEEWLNELFDSVDVEVPGELDDVMVVDELSTRSCMKEPSPLQKECDEDCLILDGDPDKVVSVVDGQSESVDGCAELLIVGEKGHVLSLWHSCPIKLPHAKENDYGMDGKHDQIPWFHH